MTRQTKRLAEENSPYLQQQADNPVDWYSWCAEALQRAQTENKPILLSIGYSACHWCHVMAHESFEDEETAKLMNELYVNIKVDREERPDLDKIYQTAQYLLTQRSGGWPLTMFLTPNGQVPFFGGTYFPNEPRHGLPAFRDLLKGVSEFYYDNQSDLEKQNETMKEALGSVFGPRRTATRLDINSIQKARQQLEENYDERLGGFGSAPKFPHPTNLERLLRHWASSKLAGEEDQRALHMVSFTLKMMALGGIYDQLGGGFCRYSIDDRWMIPHFEKMLYDNGPLLSLYSEAYAATGEPVFRRVAHETALWTIREMQSPEGAYYSTLDADSEGEEGKFYVWTQEEVHGLLNDHVYPVFARRYGVDKSPNFEGKWHLHVHAELEALAKEFDMSKDNVQTCLDEAKLLMFQKRAMRVRPGRDEKILTSWNALMIKGMAAAGRYLDESGYVSSAFEALAFTHNTLWKDGRLLATYKDGKAHLQAYLDDYAFLIDAILELLQIRWQSRYLFFACELADVLLDHFEDKQNGGFYFTADDHEQLVQRPKALGDEATPSGNGIAARVPGGV